MKIKPRPHYLLTDEEFHTLYNKVPRLTVQLVCKTTDGILFTKRAIEPSKGIWHLPGGTVIDETYIEAAHRTAQDEIGVEIEIKQLLGIIPYEHSRHSTPFNHSIMLLVTMKSNDIQLDEQASEYKFFKELPDYVEEEVADFFNTNKSAIFDE